MMNTITNVSIFVIFVRRRYVSISNGRCGYRCKIESVYQAVRGVGFGLHVSIVIEMAIVETCEYTRKHDNHQGDYVDFFHSIQIHYILALMSGLYNTSICVSFQLSFQPFVVSVIVSVFVPFIETP